MLTTTPIAYPNNASTMHCPPVEGEMVSAWASHTGLVRAHNEDACFSDDRRGLYLIADGMGGYNAGEIASKIAIDEVRFEVERSFNPSSSVCPTSLRHENEHLLENCAILANNAIRKTASMRPECLGMGTTLVAVLVSKSQQVWGGRQAGGRQASIAYVGDSRCYLYSVGLGTSPNRLSLLTKDHSVAQELISRGAMKASDLIRFPMKGVLTRALGAEDDVLADTLTIELTQNDHLMLCSDGLTDLLAHEELQTLINEHIQQGHQAVCDALIGAALARGGNDNISVMVI
jgi:PPM family protein phosphatase